MAVPAFLCTNILPVLTHYHIEPVFIDSNPDTFSLDAQSYTGSFKSALVVATYGKIPDASRITSLKERGVLIIEDYAHVPLPDSPEVISHPRYYSVAKTLPVPDGGIALIPKEKKNPHTHTQAQISLHTIKNRIKVWRPAAGFVFWLRTKIQKTETHAPSWHGITAMSTCTHRLLSYALLHKTTSAPLPFTYCYPIQVSSPQKKQKNLLQHGIISEQIWNPIIVDMVDTDTKYPNAQDKKRRTLCVPLWHIRTQQELLAYENTLKHVLPNEFTGFGN